MHAVQVDRIEFDLGKYVAVKHFEQVLLIRNNLFFPFDLCIQKKFEDPIAIYIFINCCTIEK